jgi:hypothetical protein
LFFASNPLVDDGSLTNVGGGFALRWRRSAANLQQYLRQSNMFFTAMSSKSAW